MSKVAGIRWARLAIVLCGAVALYLLGRYLEQFFVERFDLHLRGYNEPVLHRAIMAATAAYIVLLAVPFMPGIEIGLGMLMILGPKIAFLVYLSTVTALALSYLAGRLIPVELAAKACGALGFGRAQEFLADLAPRSAPQRLEWLARKSPASLVPFLVRHRYLALAALLNLPGNAVLGGGGGIALAAGMMRLYPLPAYLLTVAFAVAPVPLMLTLGAGF